MKIATWNVNSLKVRLPHLLRWLEENPVDVLCLQETKLTDDKFPIAEINAAGYQVAFSGQKTYNGVAILSKLPDPDVVRNNPRFDDEQQRILAATIDGVRIICAYVPNGQAVDSDKYVYKLALAGLAARMAGGGDAHARAAGDPGRLQHRARRPRRARPGRHGRDRCCARTEGTRRAVALIELGLTDSFRLFEQPEKCSAGGITACWASRRTRGCASITSCCRSAGETLHRLRHRPRAAQMGTAVRSRAGGRHPRIY